MKKYERYFAVLITVILLLTAGCGSGVAATETAMVSNGAMSGGASADTSEEAVGYEEISVDSSDASAGLGTEAAASGQKLIKTVDLYMETREFDTLLAEIQTRTQESGGYIESSDVSGVSYSSARDYRSAWLRLRVPAEGLENFVSDLEELGNVINKSESVEDITLSYVDTESHKKALETEQERLLELMEQAESMEDIITIESRLSEIRYELQSYESTLRAYDNQVEYSTLYVDIREVERETAAEAEEGFFGEVGRRLSDNFYYLGQGIRSFAIWFISSLPYLAAALIVLFVGARLVQKIVWKKPFFRRKKDKEDQEET